MTQKGITANSCPLRRQRFHFAERSRHKYPRKTPAIAAHPAWSDTLPGAFLVGAVNQNGVWLEPNDASGASRDEPAPTLQAGGFWK